MDDAKHKFCLHLDGWRYTEDMARMDEDFLIEGKSGCDFTFTAS